MKLKMKTANYILGIVGILGGLIIVILAFVQSLPFVKKGLPGPGFFPILCGIGVAACSLMLMAENHRKVQKVQKSSEENSDLEAYIFNKTEMRNFLYIIGASIFVLILTKLVGLLISTVLAVIGLVKMLGKENWKNSILIGLGTLLVLYTVFNLFLGVPLPNSYFGF